MHVIETIDYNPYVIEVWHDANAYDMHPITDGEEGLSQSLIYNNNGIESLGGEILPDGLSRQHIKDNASAICELLEYPSLLQLCRNFNAYSGTVQDCVNDAIYYHRQNNLDNSDKIEFMSILLEFAGIPHHHESVSGYVQSQWHSVLVIVDPDRASEIPDHTSYLKALANEYRLWAYGDVYGYSVFKTVTCDCCNHVSREIVDSCGGYICEPGTDYYKQMIDQAREHCGSPS